MFFESFSITAVAVRWGLWVLWAFLLTIFIVPLALHAKTSTDSIEDLQHMWAEIRYHFAVGERELAFEKLAAKAHIARLDHANDPNFLIWEGIVLSSWAGERGGLGALGLVKDAKILYEQAIAINPNALDGSAYSSLGVLYYKVPGWPLGFGDKTKAAELLKKALAINPRGIDANYFFADYLYEQGDSSSARIYAEQALKAPSRIGRELADKGRREELAALLAKIERQ